MQNVAEVVKEIEEWDRNVDARDMHNYSVIYDGIARSTTKG